MVDQVENDGSRRKSRKKLVYQKILLQMEFYFSPANLAKDRWLSNKLQEEECIHLTEFLKFNKIKALTENVNDLAKALRKSDLLTVTEDLKVKRTQPIEFKENEDEYVIYVEQVPPDADHDWLKTIFSSYGDIDYISLPRFKNSNKCKGFAFIEFSKPEFAHNVVQDFKEKGNYLSTDIAPEELLSIANYGDNKESKDAQGLSGTPVQEDRQPLESEESNSRKRKISQTENDEPEEKKKREDNEEEYYTDAQDTSAPEDSSELEESGNVKKKKNRKKKSKKKKRKETNDNCGLQILTKKDWKRLRNKYLNMQKEKMKQLKKHLFMAQKKSDPSRQNQNATQKKRNGNARLKNEDKKEIKKEIPEKEFVPGLIVKIKFDEPVIEVKNLKIEMKKTPSIKYVDVKEGDNSVHLRFESPETAAEFCSNSTWPRTKILQGQKEMDYWEKLQKQRSEKRAAKVTKKDRGKEKLMKKAEHILGKHIIFDEI